LDELESEKERIVSGGARLIRSMLRRRRILTTWAVREAWEIFSLKSVEVIKKSF